MSGNQTLDDSATSVRAGGRPLSDGWLRYGFSKVNGEKGKNLAKCGKCHQALTNTSIIRMAKHRKKCGIIPNSVDQCSITILKDDSEKPNEANKVRILESVTYTNEDQNALKAIYWTEERCEVEDEQQQHVLQVEKIERPPTTIDMIQDNRHESNKKSPTSKKYRGSSSGVRTTNSNVLDATLSRFIIGCNLSFDVVDSSHFKRFANAMNPNYVVPSSSVLKSRVLNQLQTLDPSSSSKKRRYESYSETESD